MKKFALFVLLVCIMCVENANAQQDPQYTQYMYNMNVVNPAYAGSKETLSLTALYRKQWSGLEGAPETITFSGHSPVNDKVGLGLSVIKDELGPVQETNAYIDVAYVFNVSSTTRLSLGIKAGATFFSTDFNGFVYSDPLPDPAFANNLNETFPNIGFGAFYFGERFYLGLSAPNLLKSEHLENDSGIVTSGSEEVHFFFTGGYVFTLSDSVKLKPAFMSKAVTGAPVSVDLTTNVLINNTFEIGAGYRFDDSFSGMVNMRVLPGLRIGYAYDYTISNLGKFNNGSHEIMLLFDINKLGKGYDKSPRFF